MVAHGRPVRVLVPEQDADPGRGRVWHVTDGTRVPTRAGRSAGRRSRDRRGGGRAAGGPAPGGLPGGGGGGGGLGSLCWGSGAVRWLMVGWPPLAAIGPASGVTISSTSRYAPGVDGANSGRSTGARAPGLRAIGRVIGVADAAAAACAWSGSSTAARATHWPTSRAAVPAVQFAGSRPVRTAAWPHADLPRLAAHIDTLVAAPRVNRSEVGAMIWASRSLVIRTSRPGTSAWLAASKATPSASCSVTVSR